MSDRATQRDARAARRKRMRVHSQQNRSRVLLSLVPIAVMLVIGTIGYQILEGWGWIDSLYMTLITLTTVGFGEIHPLGTTGRIFTMGLVILGFAVAGYAVTQITAFVVEGEFNRIIRGRRMDQRITRISDHVILCGGGRTGRHIAAELYKTMTPFVLIEQDEEVIEDIPYAEDMIYLTGDATQDDILHLAGISRAKGLVASLGDDKDNLYIVLSARAMNPNLRIIARVVDEENSGKMIRAGADEIVAPNQIGGLRMASVMLRPTVVSFLDEMLRGDDALRIEEFHIDEAPSLIGSTLGEAHIGQRTGLLVMAIKPGGSSAYTFNPGASTRLEADDVLIVMGTPEQREMLRGMG